MCGIVGISAPSGYAAHLAHAAIAALQHRGQESWGVGVARARRIEVARGLGLVRAAPATIGSSSDTLALAHTRYSTTGASTLPNSQPLTCRTRAGDLALAHNGNITNANGLRRRLRAAGYRFRSTSDSEVILALLATSSTADVVAAVRAAGRALEGAYSVLAVLDERLVAYRDPHGFRPLVLGTAAGDVVAAASETCALDVIGCTDQREVEPGELVVVDGQPRSYRFAAPAVRSFCAVEHVYFASRHSRFGNSSVAAGRVRSGRELAREAPVDADIVVPVPASGSLAAAGYAEESGLPYVEALVRAKDVGRTFIEPEATVRERMLRTKFGVLPGLDGRSVVLVDDSIVRGSTMRHVVRLVFAAGAAQVHVRVASPPLVDACRYGIDIATRDELPAARLPLEQVRAAIGATSLEYLSLAGLMRAIGTSAEEGLCTACLALHPARRAAPARSVAPRRPIRVPSAAERDPGTARPYDRAEIPEPRRSR